MIAREQRYLGPNGEDFGPRHCVDCGNCAVLGDIHCSPCAEKYRRRERISELRSRVELDEPGALKEAVVLLLEELL